MIACVDVDYRQSHAVAACILLRNWTDAHCVNEFTARLESVKPYQPGQFYKRELYPLLRVLSGTSAPIRTIVIDGYVWLRSEKGTPGLGAYLYDALDKRVPVIGVAKNRFKDADFAIKVLRGSSKRPLYVTAAGMSPRIAAVHISKMHGEHRIPTMLRKVDQLCRRRQTYENRFFAVLRW